MDDDLDEDVKKDEIKFLSGNKVFDDQKKKSGGEKKSEDKKPKSKKK